ncbi:MAG TPA: C39 family peptidase [Bryobacteraceae bacterium]|jgi:ABC-type bacteriocin/lantibiotic exporter with double-glycine peptidase domain|nr:C39 family peptidase [Bryobacteraceae bacterium]
MSLLAARIWLAGLSLLPALLCAETSAVWLDVPFVKQEANGCGAAAIAMVMHYWSRPDADPHKIYQSLYSREVDGIRGRDLDRFLRESGFHTFAFRGEWQDLEQHLAKGRPLIVCLREGRAGPLHYVVVAGVDTTQNLVLINDPARRKLLKVERVVFEKDWTTAGRWTLLAVPQQPQ